MSAHSNKKSSSKDIAIWLPVLLTVALAGGVWIGMQMPNRYQQTIYVPNPDSLTSTIPMEVGRVEEIIRFIDARYLEKIDDKKLKASAIRGMLKELDPHSNFISTEDLPRIAESLKGGFEGIGVEFTILDDTVSVVGVFPKGPSSKAGVEVGDKIIMVDDSLVAGQGITNEGIMKLLKGPAGSSVEIKVARQNAAGLVAIQISRGQIPIPSVDISYMLNETTGYIKISRFSRTTHEEFERALYTLVSQSNMQDLVIDLRDNPGGYLSAATDILNELFKEKRLLVYTKGRSYRKRDYHSKGSARWPVQKIAILIDEGSASASEIMAGAIQDNDRGVIVGRRSFGKGLVQEQYILQDSSALRLTVARYFTPSGRSIQKPYAEGRDSYEDDMQHRFDSGELFYRDSIKILDSTEYKTTSGRIVYGGGGIIPDVFVPLDTIAKNKHLTLVNLYLTTFTYRYMDKNRQELQDLYTTYDVFAKDFKIDPSFIDELIAYVETKGIEVKAKDVRAASDHFERTFKAQVAKQLFRDEGFYKSINSNDEMIEMALKQLTSTSASLSSLSE